MEASSFQRLLEKLKTLTRVSDKTLAEFTKEIRIEGNWFVVHDTAGSLSIPSNKTLMITIEPPSVRGQEEYVSELLSFLLKRCPGLLSFRYDPPF